MGELMRYRLKTPEGQRLYRLRKQTVEPVFGIIKQAMGFRRFSLRGLANVSTEWVLVCLSYNLKRLFNLSNEADSQKTSPSEACPGLVLPQSAHLSPFQQPVATFLRFVRHFIYAFEDHCRIVLSPTGC